MKLTEMREMYEKDTQIDKLRISDEVSRIPRLVQKYLDIKILERRLMDEMESQKITLNRILLDYYRGFSTKEDLEILERKPWQRVFKTKIEAQAAIESDEAMIRLNSKMAYQKAKIEFLDIALKEISNRSYLMRTLLDAEKLYAGVG